MAIHETKVVCLCMDNPLKAAFRHSINPLEAGSPTATNPPNAHDPINAHVAGFQLPEKTRTKKREKKEKTRAIDMPIPTGASTR
jgi:hypothetical protein